MIIKKMAKTGMVALERETRLSIGFNQTIFSPHYKLMLIPVINQSARPSLIREVLGGLGSDKINKLPCLWREILLLLGHNPITSIGEKFVQRDLRNLLGAINAD